MAVTARLVATLGIDPNGAASCAVRPKAPAESTSSARRSSPHKSGTRARITVNALQREVVYIAIAAQGFDGDAAEDGLCEVPKGVANGFWVGLKRMEVS